MTWHLQKCQYYLVKAEGLLYIMKHEREKKFNAMNNCFGPQKEYIIKCY